MFVAGCSTTEEMRFVPGRGDAGQFLLRHAVARGGSPDLSKSMSEIQGPWRYSEDEFGVFVRLPREKFEQVESLLLQAFGPPRLGPSETTDNGMLGVYRLTEQGGAIQFGYDSEGTYVIVIRRLSPAEFAEAMVQAMEILAKENRSGPD